MSILVELPEQLYQRDAFAAFAAVAPYSLGTARAMAWMSQLAYETADRNKVERICKLFELHLLDSVANDRDGGSDLLPIHTRAVIAEGHGAIIIAFAGTDPLIPGNWITDLDVGLRFRFNERVTPPALHSGFEKAYRSVAGKVAEALAKRSETPVLVTGHSMGAALAVIAADDLLSDKKLHPTAIYGFGMPRVGDADFANRYNDRLGNTTYRLVHGSDIVATVPPSSFGFRHVGRLIRCGQAGRFAPDQPTSEFSDEPQFTVSLMSGLQQGVSDLFGLKLQPFFRDDALGRMSGLLAPPIADHLPDRYWHACEG
jgi:triacylglycerol lipase